jgi:hypothetical protein
METIKENNLYLFDRFKKEPPHPSYISGFIDGDGCIFIRKIKDGYQSGISITQCRTNILQIIRYHFGGSITTTKSRNNFEDIMNDCYYDKYNKRNQFNLIIRSNEYQLLLEYIKNSIIIKKTQVNALYEFNKIINKQNVNVEKEKLFEICKNNNVFTNENNTNNLNIEYISGLFDAEGCLFINKKCKKYYISITQSKYPYILYKIKDFLNFGVIDKENKYKIYSKENCLKFIEYTKKYLIVKYNQACAFETFLKTDDMNVKEEMYKICNEEKHKTEIFSDLNQNHEGKEGYFETLKIRELKKNICKEIQKKEIYKLKSIKMMGEGNHNYGKEKSVETRKKMSTSIRDSKNGVSDEIIISVRKMIEEGKPNIEIQELMNLPRHTVSRIKNGNLVCRNENKLIKTTTQTERNIKKRKIMIDEILMVIDKIIEGNSPIKILNELYEKNKNITIDIVKNIKKQICQNKIPFYDFEISKETYEKYKNIIQEYNEINKSNYV